MITLGQRDYLMNLIESEPWFTKHKADNLLLWESTADMTEPQYKKALALLFNNKPESEEFISQFFIYDKVK